VIATVVARELASAYPLLQLPPVTISCSHEHSAWRGTVSISSSTLHAIVDDIYRSITGSGLTSLVLVNCHGGTFKVWLGDVRCGLTCRLAVPTLRQLRVVCGLHRYVSKRRPAGHDHARITGTRGRFRRPGGHALRGRSLGGCQAYQVMWVPKCRTGRRRSLLPA
jgi:hypothetical protein